MDIVINFNKKRKWILACINVIFIISGLWMVLNPGKFTFHLLPFDIFIRIVGLISLLFFGFGFLISIRSLYFRKVALIIKNVGIMDNSNYLGLGFLAWHQIRGIYQINEGAVYMIKIELLDANYFIEKEASFIKKILLKKQHRKFGSPVIIPMIALSAYVDTLEKQLIDRWDNYKQNSHESK